MTQRTNMNRFLANLSVLPRCAEQTDTPGPRGRCPNHYSEMFDERPKIALADLLRKQTLCPVCSKKMSKVADSLNKIVAAW